MGRIGFEPMRHSCHRFTVCCYRPLSHLPLDTTSKDYHMFVDAVGFEPTTHRLKVGNSTTELRILE